MKTLNPEYTYTDPEGQRWTLTRVKRNHLPGFITGVRIEDGRKVTRAITGAHTVKPWTPDITLPANPTGASVASVLPAQVCNDHPPGTADSPLQ